MSIKLPGQACYTRALFVAAAGLMDSGERTLDAILDEALSELPLPARIRSWAQRAGAETLRDLVSQSPSDLAERTGLGPSSLERIRAVIEARCGRGWASLRSSLGSHRRPSAGLSVDAAWDDLFVLLPDSVLAASPSALGLPETILRFCGARGLETVADLAAIPAADLAREADADWLSLDRARGLLVHAGLADSAVDEDASALAALRRKLATLESAPRMVLTRRAALLGRSQTLGEVAEILGVDTERVRQLERDALAALRWPRTWLDRANARLNLLANGPSVPLGVVVADPWWRELASNDEAFVYFIERIAHSNHHVVALGEYRLLATVSQRVVDTTWRTALDAAREWPYPMLEGDFRRRCARHTSGLGSALHDAVAERLGDVVQWSDSGAGNRLALAFGRDRQAEVMDWLRSQPAPVDVTVLWERFPRCRVPDEAILFGIGQVGLPQHFPAFELWSSVVPRACVQVMEESEHDRQWNVRALLDALREFELVPAWFTPWHVVALLRHSDEVEYLGNFLVALPREDDGLGPAVLSELVRDALEERGQPMTLEEIAAEVTSSAEAGSASLLHTLRSSGFVQLGDGTWGLMERDLEGGERVAEEVRDYLVDVIEERQEKVLLVDLGGLVEREFSKQVASTDTLASLIRADERLILWRSGYVTLRAWGGLQPARTSCDAPGHAESDVVEAVSVAAEGNDSDVLSTSSDHHAAILASTRPEASRRHSVVELPPVLLSLDRAIELLRDYEPPEEPALSRSLLAQVQRLTKKLIEDSDSSQLTVVEKYVDEKILYLLASDSDWMRGLGRTVQALRHIQILEKSGELSLGEETLRLVRAGLFYLVNREDVIGDETAEIGYLDDAHAVAFCSGRIAASLLVGKVEAKTVHRGEKPGRTAMDELMAAFRQAGRECGRTGEEELLRAVNRRLGYDRLGTRIRERLQKSLGTALARRIVVMEAGQLMPGPSSFSSYSRDELVDILSLVMLTGQKYERREVTEAVTRHLGFQRVTESVRETMASVFNSGIRRGVLRSDSAGIWRD